MLNTVINIMICEVIIFFPLVVKGKTYKNSREITSNKEKIASILVLKFWKSVPIGV